MRGQASAEAMLVVAASLAVLALALPAAADFSQNAKSAIEDSKQEFALAKIRYLSEEMNALGSGTKTERSVVFASETELSYSESECELRARYGQREISETACGMKMEKTNCESGEHKIILENEEGVTEVRLACGSS